MEPIPTESRPFRFRMRTLLVAVALVGLIFAVVAREAHFRAELRRERARTQANRQIARAAVDQFYTQVAGRSAANGLSDSEQKREVLERSMRFDREMASKASSPEERSKIRDRIERIRPRLEEK